jgi:hypothetical protein
MNSGKDTIPFISGARAGVEDDKQIGKHFSC